MSRKPLFAWDAEPTLPKARPNTYDVDVWVDGRCAASYPSVAYHDFDPVFAAIFQEFRGREPEIRFRQSPHPT